VAEAQLYDRFWHKAADLQGVPSRRISGVNLTWLRDFLVIAAL
jgi:hypothetical protein